VRQIALDRVQSLVSCLGISESCVKYVAWGILYRFSLLNKPKLNKVYHFLYDLFLGRIQGEKLGGVLENKLSNIIYRFIIFREYIE
jgi:hypothetical protein